MGFYLRKSFGLGPLRLNLSKSGLGASFGVKGARVGVNARGRAYVHAGRGGFYFRETLPVAPSQQRRDGASTSPPVDSPAAEEPIRHIESGASVSLTDAGQASLVAELTRVYKRKSRAVIVAVVSVAVLVVLLAALNPATPGGWGLLLLAVGVVGAFAFWRARISDERDGTLRLTFDFDNDAEQRYMALTSALARLARCQRVWAVETEQKTGDWKRNAGATSLVKRTLVQPSSVLPKGVESSHEVICLPAGKQKLYFFPNALLVYDRHGVGAISYTELKSEADSVAFTEEQETPSDGQVLRTTWRYVNKSGGPDRRFSNNAELRVMKYGVLALRSSSGLNELFHASDHRVIEPINGAINAIGAVQVQASIRSDETDSPADA